MEYEAIKDELRQVVTKWTEAEASEQFLDDLFEVVNRHQNRAILRVLAQVEEKKI